MLTSLQIGNFKAFEAVQAVPIKPITLIYGANSSGKSSILHSLLLARHAIESGDLDIHRTTVGGEAVDLGGFGQFIHKREISRRMQWSAVLDTSSFSGRMAELLAKVRAVKVSLELGLTQIEEMKEQDGTDPKTGKKIKVKVPTGRMIPSGRPEILTYSVLGDDKPLVEMSKRPGNRLQVDRLDHEHPVFRDVVKAIIETSTTTETVQPSDYEGLDEAINAAVPEIVVSAGKFLPEGLVKSETAGSGGQSTLFPVSKGRRKEDLAAAVSFFIPRTLDELIRGLTNSVSSELLKLQYLGPLRSYPPRHLAYAQHHDPNWYAGGGYAWDIVRLDSEVRARVNQWLQAPERLQTPYELMIRDLVGLDQIEDPLLEGLEILSEEGLDIDHEIDEDEVGHSWAIIKDPEEEARKLRDFVRSSDIDKLNELIMLDRRSNTVVSHRDVGIGVSQVLPVLVGAYAAKNRILAIEQPEIHLHPALQSDLGDVFISSALGEGKNRFLLETHSEHLLLRIMKRMRQTFTDDLPEGFNKVTPDDVCVLFVEPDGSKSIVREMPLNERGELVKAWPGGFFEEGLREVF